MISKILNTFEEMQIIDVYLNYIFLLQIRQKNDDQDGQEDENFYTSIKNENHSNIREQTCEKTS